MHHQARKFAFATTITLMATGLIACGKFESGTKPGGKPRVALIMKSLANEFFLTMANGARAHHEKNTESYDLVVNGIKDERDLSGQVALVEQMVSDQVEAIIIAPADSKALVTACKRAMEAGIIVVNIDNKLDAEVLDKAGIQVPFVGPDNRAGARKVGEHLAGLLEKGDEVAILEGVRTAFNGQQRRAGFEDAMKAAGMKIVDSQSGEWEMAKANQVASAMISEYPELKALLCSNDSMALGAMAAVRAVGREKEIAIVGFDNISAIQEAVKTGRVAATADQHGDQLAVFGIEYALQILRGDATPKDKETPVDLITADTLK